MKKIPLDLKSVSPYQLEQAKLFARYSIDTNIDLHVARGQSDLNAIHKQMYSGKVAEFAVCRYLVSKGKEPSQPDLNIYDIENKSYDADLICGDTKIHVKSHIVSDKYAVSWVFQKRDNLITEPSSNDFLALVVFDKKGSYFYLVKASDVTYKAPLKEELRNNKVCIYESDL